MAITHTNNSLAGKNILVTGGVQGIGRAIVERLHAAGATLIVTDIQQDKGEALVHTFPERLHFFTADMRKANALQPVLEWLNQQQQQLHVAINNAGVEHPPKPLLECTEADWDRTLDVNLKGVFLAMQQQIKHMLNGGGHIINLGSVAGLRAAPNLAPYAASKHGVVGLTRSVAMEYARHQIRVNAVCPGLIETEMMQRAFVHMPEKTQIALLHANPMRRFGQPNEIANAVAWLASDECSFMTGQCLTLDGGMTA